jgi:hypothetical protein
LPPSSSSRTRTFAADAAANVTPAEAAGAGGRVLTVPLAQTGEGIKECEVTQWFVEVREGERGGGREREREGKLAM